MRLRVTGGAVKMSIVTPSTVVPSGGVTPVAGAFVTSTRKLVLPPTAPLGTVNVAPPSRSDPPPTFTDPPLPPIWPPPVVVVGGSVVGGGLVGGGLVVPPPGLLLPVLSLPALPVMLKGLELTGVS